MDATPALNSMVCNGCGKKLAETKIKDGIVSIICGKCGTLNTLEKKSTQSVQNTSGKIKS